MAIREQHKIIQSKLHGNCVVIHGYMFPLTDFLSGPLCKPSLEVEQRAAFSSLFDPHDRDTDIYHRVIDSLESYPMMNYLRTTVCLTLVRIIPDDDGERRQEMWVVKVNDRRDIAVYGTCNEWKQVLQASELAKECGWETFLAQKAQEEHKSLSSIHQTTTC